MEKRVYSAGELLEALKKKNDELQRIPGPKDVDKDPNMAWATTYRAYFGTFNNALEAAGLLRPIDPVEYIRDELEKICVDGFIPTTTWLIKNKHSKLLKVVFERFGSWDEVLVYYGYKQPKNNEYDEYNKALEQIKALFIELKRKPVLKDFEGRDDVPSPEKIEILFGSLRAALDAADIEHQYNSPEEAIEALKTEKERLGRVPTMGELKVSNHGLYMASFKFFDGYRDFCKQAGLK